MTGKYRKKLIEVALPLDAINKESAREKSIRHGHPSTLHLWWARRPLAACRAVLFSSLVNDPGDDPMYSIDPEIEATERAKLFDLIEELVKWENSNDPRVINAARLEIARSIAANKVADKELKDDTPLVANAPQLPEEQAKYLPEPPAEYTAHDIRWKMPSLKPEQVNHFLAYYAPPVLDPFAGGGSIPLEAQRLGLRAYASDLNPVPVLINKALIEIPPKFAGMPPVNPKSQEGKLKTKVWRGAEGLADDVRYYGQWMRDEAEKRIGHLYPKVKVTEEMATDRSDLKPYVGKELTVIAWLWCRTIATQDPSLDRTHVPLVSSFYICRKTGNEAWVKATVDRESREYHFEVQAGKPPAGTEGELRSGTKVARGKFGCLLSGQPFAPSYVKEEGNKGNLKHRLLAIVLAGNRRRLYLSPEFAGKIDIPVCDFLCDSPCPEISGYFNPPIYGLKTIGSLFSPRQRFALKTFGDLVSDATEQVLADGADVDYARAVATCLALGVSRMANRLTSCSIWHTGGQKVEQIFSEQGVPMAWDFAEANPFSGATGSWDGSLEWIPRCLENSPNGVGIAYQSDAASPPRFEGTCMVSTDPPYYSSITYADFSDFFYPILRHALREQYPDLFATMLTPKAEEAVAAWHRFDGDREAASRHFTQKLGSCFRRIQGLTVPDTPVTIYYAFKQTELESEDGLVTAWESILRVVLDNGLGVVHTWPMRTEQTSGRKAQKNVLASSVVLVCRPRSDELSIVTRRDFANALRSELPDAIKYLQSSNVAPVDLAQASIGPGMAVFSRYQQVVNADGLPMSVREALQMINQVLDESLNEQEADFDSETRFAVRWFEQYGENDGPFGDAETLAKAMAVAVSGVVEAGILASKGGKVRLLKRDQLDANWNPATDKRSTIWECTQHLIRRLEEEGESAAAQLLADIQQAKGSEAGEVARELSYRLYSTCERKSRAAEARSYNGLVVSWPEISRMARDLKNNAPKAEQRTMFGEES
ncbi:hypothetical protein Enr10x_53960 [Gimesia panareensis]|uniref:DUF1156 domain-containing protein n=1 Tax=Gimesia panareensis TaxID=2527978 RepID=A0A517QER2_9PLAN|nr:DUF1156 domain-containing protein [Gimesia panareensis]QDT30037.1 hypothetical protein Enr10x_53960 [Gimesia panareensis]